MRQKRKWSRLCWGCFILTVFLITSMTVSICAQEEQGLTVYIPIEQDFSVPDKETAPSDHFEYQLLALDPETPLPEDEPEAYYLFAMDGNCKLDLGPFHYDHAGVYRYQIRQVVSRERERYTYDDQKYLVEVYVSNGSEGLSSQIVVLNKNQEKCENVKFQNSYKPDKIPTQNHAGITRIKTGDQSHISQWLMMMFLTGCLMVISKKANRVLGDS